MTQEEKAKAYDEALERVRNLYNKMKYLSSTDARTTVLELESSFPKLAEDEDERIRKEIIEYLQRYLPTDELLKEQEMVAWLEKQKEQKPAESSNEELQSHHDELYDFKVFAARQAREHHISFVHDFEWNNFCEELLSYFNEKQKPVEWSEEDKSIIEGACNALEVYGHTKLANKLKSLRPVKQESHWKPSKQEIDTFETALKGEFKNGVYPAVRLCELFQKLKKLYYNDKIPSWKPSKEQMEALMYAIEGKWDMIKPTSYLSRRLEDLYDGLVNTYNVNENSEYIYPEDKK